MDKLALANDSTIALARGDITTFSADAIVNAANAYLAPGGGVSGAIHRAGGPELTEECADLSLKRGLLSTGESVITGGHQLPAAHVIHALGPIWHAGESGEAAALARTYRGAIELADENGLATVAFPSISTGIFGYPVDLAAPIALEAVSHALESAAHVREVVFVLYDEATFGAFSAALQSLLD